MSRESVTVAVLQTLGGSRRLTLGQRKCRYGASCYQRNPQHRIDFWHPTDRAFLAGFCDLFAACRLPLTARRSCTAARSLISTPNLLPPRCPRNRRAASRRRPSRAGRGAALDLRRAHCVGRVHFARHREARGEPVRAGLCVYVHTYRRVCLRICITPSWTKLTVSQATSSRTTGTLPIARLPT